MENLQGELDLQECDVNVLSGVVECLNQIYSLGSTLEEIVENSDIVLIDTNSLIAPLHRYHLKKEDKLEKIEYYNSVKMSAQMFLRAFQDYGQLYLTQGVLKEFYHVRFRGDYKKKIKQMSKYSKPNKDLLELRRIFKSAGKARRQLSNFVEVEDRIFRLSEEQVFTYNHLSRQFDYVFNRKGIGDNDRDLLLRAMIASTQGRTTLISNDFPLMYSYVDVMRRKDVFNPSSDFNFYLRKGHNVFERNISF